MKTGSRPNLERENPVICEKSGGDAVKLKTFLITASLWMGLVGLTACGGNGEPNESPAGGSGGEAYLVGICQLAPHPALDAATLTPGGTVTARVTVKNSGAMRGAEVVQLYVADATGAPVPGGRVPQALRRFAKIDLQPGEEREIVFTLTPQDISRYSPELHAWCAAPGRYEIRIGHSSRDIRAVLALQYADAKI